jgi:hypothetical protein
VLVATLAGALTTACVGQTERSVRAFCSALKDGNAKMSNLLTSAIGERARLIAIATNPGEFTAMIDQMDKSAPEEIAQQMTDVRTLWHQQAANIHRIKDDPLGAIGSGIWDTFQASDSLEAVDNYALENCGETVFGVASD